MFGVRHFKHQKLGIDCTILHRVRWEIFLVLCALTSIVVILPSPRPEVKLANSQYVGAGAFCGYGTWQYRVLFQLLVAVGRKRKNQQHMTGRGGGGRRQ